MYQSIYDTTKKNSVSIPPRPSWDVLAVQKLCPSLSPVESAVLKVSIINLLIIYFSNCTPSCTIVIFACAVRGHYPEINFQQILISSDNSVNYISQIFLLFLTYFLYMINQQYVIVDIIVIVLHIKLHVYIVLSYLKRFHLKTVKTTGTNHPREG